MQLIERKFLKKKLLIKEFTFLKKSLILKKKLKEKGLPLGLACVAKVCHHASLKIWRPKHMLQRIKVALAQV